jgi:hypothetical protein
MISLFSDRSTYVCCNVSFYGSVSFAHVATANTPRPHT